MARKPSGKDAADYRQMGSKAAKADQAMDRRLGIKVGSKQDERIDRAVARAVGKGKR